MNRFRNFVYDNAWVFLIVATIFMLVFASIKTHEMKALEQLEQEESEPEPYQIVEAVEPEGTPITYSTTTSDSIQVVENFGRLEIPLDEYESILTDVILYLSENHYSLKRTYAISSNKLIIDIVSADSELNEYQIRTFKQSIQKVFQNRGYDFSIMILVLNPENEEIVDYATNW